jgi:hypothetical protein
MREEQTTATAKERSRSLRDDKQKGKCRSNDYNNCNGTAKAGGEESYIPTIAIKLRRMGHPALDVGHPG